MTEAGTLEAGISADFIVLDANPLNHITNTLQISSVILRGAAVDRTRPCFKSVFTVSPHEMIV